MQRKDITANKAVISLSPLSSSSNKFVDLFSKALTDQMFVTRSFRWRLSVLSKSDVVILHWPGGFFGNADISSSLTAAVRLVKMRLSRRLWGTRFVWVAHNAVPHAVVKPTPVLRRGFLRSLDGIIYLSAYSRSLVTEMYPECADVRSLVTVHGHYRDLSVVAPSPCRPITGDINLVFFGQVRPYKNLDRLIDAVSEVKSGLRLLIVGHDADPLLAKSLAASASKASHITLDLRDEPIGDEELEILIGASDAVVLPYRNILNSGSAIYALSRNRPIIAPKIGSLPELRDTVGQEWAFLYEGEFGPQTLSEFMDWMLRTKRAHVAPMEPYEWKRVGEDLKGFIDEICR